MKTRRFEMACDRAKVDDIEFQAMGFVSRITTRSEAGVVPALELDHDV